MPRLLNLSDPGADRPGIGFETPLAMLAECHRRVADQCRTLQRLLPHLATHGSDGPAAEAAAAVLRYFEEAAPKHHADEEQDLFPALLESMAGSDAVCLRGLIAALGDEHGVLERQWQGLRGALQRVAAGQPAALDQPAVQAFAAGYARHIAREEAELLPMAARLLPDEALERIGRAMRRRRGEAR